jgi:hypothetical protein
MLRLKWLKKCVPGWPQHQTGIATLPIGGPLLSQPFGPKIFGLTLMLGQRKQTLFCWLAFYSSAQLSS